MHEYTPSPGTPFAHAVTEAASPVTPPRAEQKDKFGAAAAEAIEFVGRRQHRRRLVASVIAVPAFLVAGSGAAYAATTIDWSSYWNDTTTTQWTGWAETPDAVVPYTLPSGRTCELRLGQFTFGPAEDRPANVSADPKVVPATLDFVRSSLTITDGDVQKVIEENRSDENWATDEDGAQVPVGYGTGNYDADVEYDIAVKEAVNDAIDAHLATVGIPSTGLGYMSEQQCTDTGSAQ